ncbi:hypothetical protein QWZ14_17020 [Paeniroseomonas aquatica]|uniref:Uncharacterized protein n=1 Tax=Paeniroseomonas aquatica TaxID=373043 RepID=A0ABT8A8V7_9PROT|nr:hypothetical protein [Paeniroseomonas aquatica]MDN3566073.1 hypothetical protein [Paeniroseomonas aquatica]
MAMTSQRTFFRPNISTRLGKAGADLNGRTANLRPSDPGAGEQGQGVPD